MIQSKLCAFDLDGVLVDTFSIHKAGWKYLLTTLEMTHVNVDFEEYKGVPTLIAIKQLLSDCDIEGSHTLLNRLVELKNLHRDNSLQMLSAEKLNLDALHILEKFRDNGCICICFATSTKTQYILQKMQIAELFDSVYSGKMMSCRKLEEVSNFVSYCCSKYNLLPSEICCIDDSFAICTKFAKIGCEAVHVNNKTFQRITPVS